MDPGRRSGTVRVGRADDRPGGLNRGREGLGRTSDASRTAPPRISRKNGRLPQPTPEERQREACGSGEECGQFGQGRQWFAPVGGLCGRPDPQGADRQLRAAAGLPAPCQVVRKAPRVDGKAARGRCHLVVGCQIDEDPHPAREGPGTRGRRRLAPRLRRQLPLVGRLYKLPKVNSGPQRSHCQSAAMCMAGSGFDPPRLHRWKRRR